MISDRSFGGYGNDHADFMMPRYVAIEDPDGNHVRLMSPPIPRGERCPLRCERVWNANAHAESAVPLTR